MFVALWPHLKIHNHSFRCSVVVVPYKINRLPKLTSQKEKKIGTRKKPHVFNLSYYHAFNGKIQFKKMLQFFFIRRGKMFAVLNDGISRFLTWLGKTKNWSRVQEVVIIFPGWRLPKKPSKLHNNIFIWALKTGWGQTMSEWSKKRVECIPLHTLYRLVLQFYKKGGNKWKHFRRDETLLLFCILLVGAMMVMIRWKRTKCFGGQAKKIDRPCRQQHKRLNKATMPNILPIAFLFVVWSIRSSGN